MPPVKLVEKQLTTSGENTESFLGYFPSFGIVSEILKNCIVTVNIKILNLVLN